MKPVVIVIPYMAGSLLSANSYCLSNASMRHCSCASVSNSLLNIVILGRFCMEYKLSILDHIDNKIKGEGVGHGNSKPVKLPLNTASMSFGVLARKTAKELDQTQEEFVQLKQLRNKASI